MRTIKFRAYLKAENKIYNVLSFFSKFRDEEGNRVFLDKPLVDGDVTNYQVDGEKVVLMQFTGLTDKNGKEIYEGDILSYKAKKKEYSDVYFDKGRFSVEQRSIRTIRTLDYHMQKYDVEIAGNRYENPELLAQ